MEEQIQIQSEQKMSTKQRRWVLGMFVLFVIFFVLIGVLSFADALFGETIQRRKAAYKRLQEQGFDFNMLLGQSEIDRMEIIRLKRTDTDGDGLSDYDELYVYGTSPYLWDTDSDGISDYDEIQMGRNPNCNEDRINCYEPLPQDLEQTRQTQVQTDQEVLNKFKEIMAQDAVRNELRATLTPFEMRNMLYRGGFDPEIVNQFTPEELVSLREIFLAPGIGADISALLDSGEIDLNHLSMDGLRDLLVLMGLPREMVRLAPDAVLVELFKDAVNDTPNPALRNSLFFGMDQNF